MPKLSTQITIDNKRNRCYNALIFTGVTKLQPSSKKSKTKFASAADKQRKEQLDLEWAQMQKSWDKLTPKFGRGKKLTVKPVGNIPALTAPPGRDNQQKIKSLNSWVTGTVSSKPAQMYTGSSIIGISQMSKSNAVPVFNHEHVVDIARMRR